MFLLSFIKEISNDKNKNKLEINKKDDDDINHQ